MKNIILSAALLIWLGITPVFAEDTHEHDDPSHSHHASETHDGHDHDEADEHEHDHDEGKTDISPESAARMGIIVEQAGAATVDRMIPLTGHITLNENTTAEIRARFTGIVRQVHVNLGDTVEKGQVLAVIESNDSLQDYNVTAPMNGVVLQRNTNIGDVAADRPLFVIADLSEVWAKFYVFSRDAQHIRVGQNVVIRTLDGNKTGAGRIDMALPTADPQSQTKIVIAALNNDNGQWHPGMSVQGHVTVSQTQAKVTVRDTALQKMEEYGDVVFVRNGNTFEPRPVKTGDKGNGFVEITDGLKAGESYVAQGSFIVKSDILKSTAAHSH